MALGLTPQQLLMKAQTVRNDMKGLGLDASEQGRLVDPASNAAYKASIERVQAAEGKKNVIGERERAAFDLMKMGFGVAKSLKPSTEELAQEFLAKPSSVEMTRPAGGGRHDVGDAGGFQQVAPPTSEELAMGIEYKQPALEVTPEQIGGMRGIFARIFGG